MKPLWDFIERRMRELGLTRYDLETEHEIPYATIQRLRAGSVNIKDGTKHKLALALKCSVGDINNAIYGRPDPEEAEEPSVMEAVDKLEDMVQAEHPDMAAPAEKLEKPKRGKLVHPYAEIQRAEEAQRKERQRKERRPEDKPEGEPEHKSLVRIRTYTAAEVEKACKEAVEQYREKLRNICLAEVSRLPSQTLFDCAHANIGRAILNELMKKDAEE